MSDHSHSAHVATKEFLAAALFYLVITLEFIYMASPFATYFYSVYGPGLNFINDSSTLFWLSSMFLRSIHH
jgi:hypothetical protein